MQIKKIHVVDLRTGMWLNLAGNMVCVTNIIPDGGNMEIRIQAENLDAPSDILKHTVDMTVDAFCYMDVYVFS